MKKIKIIITIILFTVSLGLIAFIGVKEYKRIKEENNQKIEQQQYEEAKNNYKLDVTVKNEGKVSYAVKVNLKDSLISSNATFDDKFETYYELGEKEVTLSYTDPYDRKGEYTFKINVVDNVPPVLLAQEKVTAYKGENTVMDGVVCADLLTSVVKCEVIGEYNINKLGTYKLKYRATDNAGNIAESDFTLEVINKPANTSTDVTYTNFSDIYSQHKKDNTLVGIDVSKWQGTIDFNKVKNAGAEFVIIRLGTYYNGKNNLDARYKENIKKAKAAGLKVGLYYYSEAKTEKEAIECANYLVKNIGEYSIDLPIAYDWEDWGNFSSYKLNILDFNKPAYAFMDRLKELGYKGMLYGSKKYLTYIWDAKNYDVWVAQYYKEVTYEGKYMMWQLTSTGKINGISGAVDVDILYLDKFN